MLIIFMAIQRRVESLTFNLILTFTVQNIWTECSAITDHFEEILNTLTLSGYFHRLLHFNADE